MEISRKTDYALRMIAALAHQDSQVLSARTIADEHGIPYSFARAIQHDLTRAGIVKSQRGAAGGMVLNLDLRDLSLLEVIEALQGPVLLCSCNVAHPTEQCSRLSECHFSPVWCTAEMFLRNYFASVNLHQLVCERKTPVFEGMISLVEDTHARNLVYQDAADHVAHACASGDCTSGCAGCSTCGA